MKEWLWDHLGRVLRGLFSGAALLARRWRLLLATLLLGTSVALLGWLAMPHPWTSEGYALMRPLLLREGYLLTTNELGAYYALRLSAPERVARAAASVGVGAGAAELQRAIHAESVPGGIVRLRVTLPEPTQAERLTRALLLDFRGLVEAENRTREEGDRLVVELSRVHFPRPAYPPLPLMLLVGAAVGLLVGILLALGSAWHQGRRVAAPLDAEQLTGAPTLGAIPRQRFFSR